MRWSLAALQRWAEEYPQRFDAKDADGKSMVTDTKAVLALIKVAREAKAATQGGYGFYMTGAGLTDALEPFDD